MSNQRAVVDARHVVGLSDAHQGRPATILTAIDTAELDVDSELAATGADTGVAAGVAR